MFADWANIGLYLTGGLSPLTLFWQRAKKLTFLSVLIALITFGLMAGAGRLGGLIRHKELRSKLSK